MIKEEEILRRWKIGFRLRWCWWNC